MVIFKKIFDKLNITFSSEEVKIDGKLRVRGLGFIEGGEGLTGDFVVAVGVIAGLAIYKKITVKNGLIVSVENTPVPI